MPRHFTNLFELTNLSNLEATYRLLAVRGLTRGDNYEKNLNLLAKRLAFELRQPVALLAGEKGPAVALPADSRLPTLEQRLTPQVVTLVPEDEVYPLHFGGLDERTDPIAISFLQYAFGAPLMRDDRLWGGQRRFFSKRPVNEARADHSVDIFGGFRYKIVCLEGRHLFLALDLAYKYVDRSWLTEHLSNQEIREFLMRRCLYHFGRQWYEVQLMAGTDLTIQEQKFEDEAGRVWNVWEYTKHKCGEPLPAPIPALDPGSPAIQYRNPGNEKRRYGAAALCKLTYGTMDPGVRAIHRGAMRPPDQRFAELGRIVERYFSQAQIAGRTLQVSRAPLEVPRRIFPVPDQRFGHSTVLHVKRGPHDAGIDLRELGRTRLQFLLDRKIGPLNVQPFGAQYVLIPDSLPRPIVEEFLTAFQGTMEQIIPHPYVPQRILYRDAAAPRLKEQVRALEQAIEACRIKRGYALWILPRKPHKDLHNFFKKRRWPDLQFQCAQSTNIAAFFDQLPRPGGDPEYRLKSDERSRFHAYLRHTAFGLLQVNRMWPWGLENALTYDVYIGVDV